jgi:glucose-6-phosphate 1-epimerase
VSVRRVAGSNGMPKLILTHDSGSRAELYLQGAHVTSWVPDDGVERLFLSRAARFGPGTPIRGGIPVVFPQFADNGPLPKHGFLRLHPWEWQQDGEPGDATRAVLRLDDNTDTRALWPHPFAAELQVELGAAQLAVDLAITNSGTAPFAFTAALHSYFRVADATRALLHGLQGATFLDKVQGMAERRQEEAGLMVEGELDRVYRHAPRRLQLQDRAAGRGVEVESGGFEDVVVWNPGGELGATLPDFAPGEHLEMLCVEAAQARQPVVLEPGAVWRGGQRCVRL